MSQTGIYLGKLSIISVIFVTVFTQKQTSFQEMGEGLKGLQSTIKSNQQTFWKSGRTRKGTDFVKDFTPLLCNNFHQWVLYCTPQHFLSVGFLQISLYVPIAISISGCYSVPHNIFHQWAFYCAMQSFSSVGVTIFQTEHNLFTFL